jgi:hypothetical protein
MEVQRAIAVQVLAGVEDTVGHALCRSRIDQFLEAHLAGLAVVAEIVRGVEESICSFARACRAVGADPVATPIGEVGHEARDVHRVGWVASHSRRLFTSSST